MRVDFVFWFLSVIHRHKIPTWAFSSSPLSTPGVCFSLRSGCTEAPGMHANTAPGTLHCTQCSREAAPVLQPRWRQALGSPSLSRLRQSAGWNASVQSDFPPIEVCSWEADSQPICISSRHQMRIRGAPGSCCSQWAEVPNDSVGVWVRSLILKACWDAGRYTVIRKAVSEESCQLWV